MQTTILIILLAEALILIGLAVFGKLSRKLFLLSAVPVVICCVVNMLAVRGNAGEEKEVEQKEYVCMAARLTEQDHAERALQAMSQVADAMLGECDYHLGRVATPDSRAGYEHNLVSLPSVTLAFLLIFFYHIVPTS